MGLITVQDIRVHAYHGCLPEEERIGALYRVVVSAEGDFRRAAISDELADTVDYGLLTTIVKAQMAVRSKLIEHVAHRILGALRDQWPNTRRFAVRVVKERPPVDGDVAEVWYEVEG